jgi:hypothetical protein
VELPIDWTLTETLSVANCRLCGEDG